MCARLAELGVRVTPAGDIPSVPGLVTATFAHTSGEVYNLKLKSESKPIGVTGTHPIWSDDQHDWVAVADLKPGERVRTGTGVTNVESITSRPEPEPVYNIEVDGDHVYRVSESALLVHNPSAPKRVYTFTCPFEVPDDDACLRAGIPQIDYCELNAIEWDQKQNPPGKCKYGPRKGKAVKPTVTWNNYIRFCCKRKMPITPVNPHGHHIVIKDDPKLYLYTEPSQQILCKYGIDPFYSCEALKITHNACHTFEYARCVLADLKEADKKGTKAAVIEALKLLGNAHAKCGRSGFLK